MRKDFVYLVENANILSDDFYAKTKEKLPNPFYIGFGNPNSEILILGKEKGFEYKNNENQTFYESINNPKEWNHYVKNDITFTLDKSYENSESYNNCFIPYLHKINNSGHTWNKYRKLIQEIYPNKKLENNFFLKKCFISEINHFPSKTSEINTYSFQKRLNFLKNDFYRNFKIIILACGNYLDRNKIEEIFDVKYKDDFSLPRKKLVIYENKNCILINTRQLSFDTSNLYISQIVDKIFEKQKRQKF